MLAKKIIFTFEWLHFLSERARWAKAIYLVQKNPIELGHNPGWIKQLYRFWIDSFCPEWCKRILGKLKPVIKWIDENWVASIFTSFSAFHVYKLISETAKIYNEFDSSKENYNITTLQFFCVYIHMGRL